MHARAGSGGCTGVASRRGMAPNNGTMNPHLPVFVVNIHQKVVLPLSPSRRFRHAVLLVGQGGHDDAGMFRSLRE